MTLEEIGSRAKAVSRTLNNLGSREKNIGLEDVYKRQEMDIIHLRIMYTTFF